MLGKLQREPAAGLECQQLEKPRLFTLADNRLVADFPRFGAMISICSICRKSSDNSSSSMIYFRKWSTVDPDLEWKLL